MSDHPDREIARQLRLRGDLPPVVRLSRRAVAITVGVGALAVAAVAGWALTDRQDRSGHEPLAVAPTEVRPTEQLATLPEDYLRPPADAPKLGPPLPGDLGRAMLAEKEEGAATSNAPSGAAPVASGAASGRLFAASATTNRLAEPLQAAPSNPGADQQAVAEPQEVRHALPPGHVIRAALMTGMSSDLPGPVMAQVVEDVADAQTGQVLLIPRGSRVLGSYEDKVAFGQDRLLLTWTSLVFPDGRVVDLGRETATDAAGRVGVAGKVDRHWPDLMKASLISFLFGLGAEMGGRRDEDDVVAALRDSLGDTSREVSERLIGRSLSVQPTIRVQPGQEVRVLVTKGLSLPAWRRS